MIGAEGVGCAAALATIAQVIVHALVRLVVVSRDYSAGALAELVEDILGHALGEVYLVAELELTLMGHRSIIAQAPQVAVMLPRHHYSPDAFAPP